MFNDAFPGIVPRRVGATPDFAVERTGPSPGRGSARKIHAPMLRAVATLASRLNRHGGDDPHFQEERA